VQDMTEHRRLPNGIIEEIRTRTVGPESEALLKAFEVRREQLEKRLESGETESATVRESRRVQFTDPCPCGALGVTFGQCCGSRLLNDERMLPAS
jgi:hypothetical protein